MSNDQPMLEALAKGLGLDATATADLKRNLERWEGSLSALEDELARSELVTEADLAVRINVRDYE
jgi:hypothetical protein